MDGWIDVWWVGGRTDRWMDGGMNSVNGWMNGWVGGKTDGWMDRLSRSENSNCKVCQ